MPQIINSNISSLTAQRNLNTSQNQLNTSLQRLSSGLRINSAKDDAAGLAISERFTSQIRGLNQAARNANDGVSLAQTAEGDLAAITNNLQRIRELAVQSANATNSESDRAALQLETAQLIAEIDRVASTSSFNGVNLLDGSFSSQQFQVGANAGETVDIASIASSRTSALGQTFGATLTVSSPTDVDATFSSGDLTINGSNVDATADAKAIADAITALDPNLSVTADNTKTISFTDVTGNPSELTAGASATPGVTTLSGAITNFDFAGGDSASFVVDSQTVTLDQSYGNIAGVVTAIQNTIGGDYSVSESSGVISIATNATGSSVSAPAVNTFNTNADGGSSDGTVIDFVAGTVSTNGLDAAPSSLTSTVALTQTDFSTNTLTFDVSLGGVSQGTVTLDGTVGSSGDLSTLGAVYTEIESQIEAFGGGTFAVTDQGSNLFSIATSADSASAITITSFSSTAGTTSTTQDTFATGTSVTGVAVAVPEAFTASSNLPGFDFSVDSVSFDISDGSNSTTITLNDNYTSLGGVITEINNQIAADSGPAALTASLAGSALRLTADVAGATPVVSTSTYNNNVDGNIGTQTTFPVGAVTTLAGTDSASYSLSIDGIALDLSTVGADGTVSTSDISGLIGAIDGYTVSNVLASSFDLTKTDSSNFALVEAGAESASEGIAGDGSSTAVTATYLGQITSITNANGEILIAGNDPSKAGGFSNGTTEVDATTLVGTNITDTDISDVDGANAAILSIDSALSTINTSRAGLGAIQNRFESVVSSIQTTSENLSAARSRIRDTDFAEETAALTRAQILQQAGVSILSQANSLPQNVLALLQ